MNHQVCEHCETENYDADHIWECVGDDELVLCDECLERYEQTERCRCESCGNCLDCDADCDHERPCMCDEETLEFHVDEYKENPEEYKKQFYEKIERGEYSRFDFYISDDVFKSFRCDKEGAKKLADVHFMLMEKFEECDGERGERECGHMGPRRQCAEHGCKVCIREVEEFDAQKEDNEDDE